MAEVNSVQAQKVADRKKLLPAESHGRQRVLVATLPATHAAYAINDTILLGGSGMLVRSDPLSAPVRTIRNLQYESGRGAQLDIQAYPGSTIDLHSGATPGELAPVGSLYLPVGRARITSPASASSRFFRAVPK